jgi:outer membrane protein assembly factor BamD (BamD/ComL family)
MFLAALLLAPLCPAQKVNDIVLKKDGARVRGLEITEFLLTGVRGKRGSEPFEIPAHQVATIEWSDLPDAFVTGRAAMDRGDFRTAVQMFGDVKSDRPLVLADAQFFQIKAAVASVGNDKTAAATAAERAKKWLADNANHWRTPEAMLLAGRAERLAGTGGAAATTLRELDERATRESLGVVWSARAKSELALTLLADGKSSDARTTFQAATSAADSALATAGPDAGELRALKTLARVGEGETFLLDKDFAKAESFFRALAASKEPELVAAGHAGEGEAIFQAAVANNRPEDIRRAQVAFAMASVNDVLGGEASAKANYYLGRCLLALGADREGDAFKQRANAYFQIVVSEYPSSRWAAPAKTEQTK